METSVREHQAYWRKSLTMTWIALFLWCVVTVLMGIYAREARDFTVVYGVLTGLYAWYLSRQDAIHRC